MVLAAGGDALSPANGIIPVRVVHKRQRLAEENADVPRRRVTMKPDLTAADGDVGVLDGEIDPMSRAVAFGRVESPIHNRVCVCGCRDTDQYQGCQGYYGVVNVMFQVLLVLSGRGHSAGRVRPTHCEHRIQIGAGQISGKIFCVTVAVLFGSRQSHPGSLAGWQHGERRFIGEAPGREGGIGRFFSEELFSFADWYF